jgi:hypothetical protein
MSDNTDLAGQLNGYYLQFGEAGSLDAIELFRQSGTTITPICRAADGAISAAFALCVKVSRGRDGTWQLYVDYAGGSDFRLEASGFDPTFSATTCAGMLCNYTITNVARFYYDDISLRPVFIPDTSPPRVDAVNPTSAHGLDVIFSEALDQVSAEKPTSYYCPALSAHPVSAIMDDDGKTVHLSFSNAFTNGEQATLFVSEVSDVSGNTVDEAEIAFVYFVSAPIQFRDIVLSEIFPDPAPRVALPSAEFVELYNRSLNPVQLEGWSFSDGSSIANLPGFILLPGKYLILCSSGHLQEFSEAGDALPVQNFPTLNNSGDRLILMDKHRIVIDSIDYSASWYQDEDKSEGGWSLELIDPQNICADASNWIAAVAPSGGTPGRQNSVYANKPDNTRPWILSVFPGDSSKLIVTFNEKLEKIIPDATNFHIQPPVSINSMAFADATLTAFVLVLAEPLARSTDYHLSVQNIYDCAGNLLRDEHGEAEFVLPERAVRGDIVINEILANPRPTGVDFVEVYNRSDKTIDLKNWTVSNPETASAATGFTLSDQVLLMRPGDYRVFSEDGNVLKGEYIMGRQENFIDMHLPAFNDDAGLVELIDDGGSMIDSIPYSAGMHSPFVTDPEGISLERISPEANGTDFSNWRSASSVAGLATPGYRNSNLRGNAVAIDNIKVDPEILRPDSNAGDFALIKYHFDRGGFMANVRVFDQQGHTVKELARNELLGTDGFIRWEGDQDNGSRARTGYYMIWFQIFDSTGMLQTFRRRIAVY